MTKLSQDYFSILQQIDALCDEMLASEQEKRHALLKGDEDALATVIQTQQADLMHLESLEKQRADLQKKLGLGTLTAGEIQKQLDEDVEKQAFAKVSDTLKNKAQTLKELNEVSLSIAKDQLNFIRQMTQTQPDAVRAAASYGPGAKSRTEASRPLFEEKV